MCLHIRLLTLMSQRKQRKHLNLKIIYTHVHGHTQGRDCHQYCHANV